MYTKPSTKLFIHFYLKKKGTYIKKVVQKPYYVGKFTRPPNFLRHSRNYKVITEHRLKMYCTNRRIFSNNYNSLTLSRRYTDPRGRFQLKC